MPQNKPRSTLAHVALMISLVLALGVMVAGIILVDWRLIAAPIPAWVALAILVAAGYAIADRRTPPRVPEMREQCPGGVYSGPESPPERCAFDAGHDGPCQP